MSAGVAIRRHAPAAPDINVTPLVDVVLVLLIIFMVVAPQMEQDLPVTLPGIFNPDPDAERPAPPLTITVKQAGQYYVDRQPYDLESAVAMLTAAHAAQPYRRLEVRADAKLKYKHVRELYTRVQPVGFPGVSLLVSQRYKAGEVRPVSVPASAGEIPAPDGPNYSSTEAGSDQTGSALAHPER